MELKKGCSYRIIFDINGNILTFICKIIDEDKDFITFIDKYNKTLYYNKKNIISIEEVKGERKRI